MLALLKVPCHWPEIFSWSGRAVGTVETVEVQKEEVRADGLALDLFLLLSQRQQMVILDTPSHRHLSSQETMFPVTK